MADIGQSESAEVLALSANVRYDCEYVGYLGKRAWPVISETNSIAGGVSFVGLVELCDTCRTSRHGGRHVSYLDLPYSLRMGDGI